MPNHERVGSPQQTRPHPGSENDRRGEIMLEFEDRFFGTMKDMDMTWLVVVCIDPELESTRTQDCGHYIPKALGLSNVACPCQFPSGCDRGQEQIAWVPRCSLPPSAQ